MPYYIILYYTILYYGRSATRAEPRSGRAPITRFELFELILLLTLDKQLPVEQFEATESQSTVPSPLLIIPS